MAIIERFKTIKVDAVVIAKRENTSLISRLIGGPYGGIFYKVINPETKKEFIDFIRAHKGTYDISIIGEELNLTAYRGKENPNKLYLRPDEAFLN